MIKSKEAHAKSPTTKNDQYYISRAFSFNNLLLQTSSISEWAPSQVVVRWLLHAFSLWLNHRLFNSINRIHLNSNNLVHNLFKISALIPIAFNKNLQPSILWTILKIIIWRKHTICGAYSSYKLIKIKRILCKNIKITFILSSYKRLKIMLRKFFLILLYVKTHVLPCHNLQEKIIHKRVSFIERKKF